MKRLLLVLLCLVFFPVMASHIVGGEFEIIHVSGYTYRVNLIVYFDEVNGAQAIKDQDNVIYPRIFRVSDNEIMMSSVTMVLDPNIPSVPYTQQECARGELQTTKMSYTALIELPPHIYNDPEGYYIAWERCCRNYTITNIYSNVPPALPAAGQTFYLKFPPVVMNGEQFINSSPELFPPLSDYACINKPYYANFAGTDRDGDSLVYSLVTPLSTHSAVAIPAQISPAPYPEVEWRPGFDLNGIMNGDPDLAISHDGLLTVTPSLVQGQGLFVFEVLCEEFRDGVKIGEVRRDFQMLVVDCEESVPPTIQGWKNGNLVKDNMTVTFDNTTPDDERCITVRVEDLDVFGDDSESVGIRAIPLGFKGDVSEILVGQINAELTADNSFIEFPVCFPQCPYKKGGFQIGIIAYDDACSLPLLDTLRINVNIEPPDNARAVLPPDISESVLEGTHESWTITGSDADMDALTATVIPIGFELEQIGLTYEQIRLERGLYEGRLTWDADCGEYDFNIGTDFQVMILLDDIDSCNFYEPDTLMFNLHIELPENLKPLLTTDLPPQQIFNGVEAEMFDNILFNMRGQDFDDDEITLFMEPADFSAGDLGMVFNDTTNISNVGSPFSWTLNCGSLALEEQGEFLLNFKLVEKTKKCKIYDTLVLPITIRVIPPDNMKPEFTMASLTQAMENNKVNATLGEEISILLTSTDADVDPVDHIKIEMVDADGTVPPTGFVFTAGEGSGSAQSTLKWLPDCSIFQDNIFENQYTFTFRTFDNRCQNIKGDTVILDLTVKDVDGSDLTFIPPNVVTPNGDGCNDFFAMEGFEYEAPSSTDCSTYVIPNLPFDNCIGRFSSIRIYNRWGKQVYESTQRHFRWDASGEAAGVYFYTILYMNPLVEEASREYKGTISVRY